MQAHPPNPYYDEYSRFSGASSTLLFPTKKEEQLTYLETQYVNPYRKRRELIERYSFAIPDTASLDIIREHSPIVEIGAGTGYWSHLLSELGCDVVAYDINESKWQWEKKWFPIIEGDHTNLARHADRTLFLCWANYDDDFGYQCLSVYQGNTCIVIGEGRGGCTCNNNFFDELDLNWESTKSYAIPQWAGVHDYLNVYRRCR